MSDATLLMFAIAAGYAVSGVIAHLHLAVSGEAERVRLGFGSPATAAWSVFLCAFGGPHLLAMLAWPHVRARRLPVAVVATIGVLVAIWSFCAGVFVIQAWALASMLAQ